MQRHQDPDRRVQPRDHVGDGDADHGRDALRLAGQSLHSAHALDDEVVGRPGAARPIAAEPRDRAVDQPAVDGVDALPREGQARERARREILDQHV